MYQKYYKRLFDIFLSSFLIIFFSPLTILIFFIVWFKLGFPIFTQKRPGLHNKIFTIYKFKTLYGASKNISEKKRRNSLGDFLRKTGLDELPQLFNIFSNKMSFVGPRPLLIKYLKFKGFRNHERSKCKPGITGLAQIQSFENSNNKKRKSKWKRQLNLDKEYYYNISLNLDINILYKTFLKFLKFNKTDFYNEPRLQSKHLEEKTLL
jgi:lipopolysaccharide/colanic/teichoic acid biosynthesis glycosyltransferase